MIFKEETRLKTCCFTGHRPEKFDTPDITPKDILGMVEDVTAIAIKDGYDTFISGMSRGTDIWAALDVLNLKKEYPIKLICAVPFKGFEKSWSDEWKRAYNYILEQADEVVYICEKYSRSSFMLRNKWMVDRSSRVIAAYLDIKGGTRNTIKYATKKGLDIWNILNDERYTASMIGDVDCLAKLIVEKTGKNLFEILEEK